MVPTDLSIKSQLLLIPEHVLQDVQAWRAKNHWSHRQIKEALEARYGQHVVWKSLEWGGIVEHILFWHQVAIPEVPDACWLWKGSTSRGGYGCYRRWRALGRGSQTAHRMAWMLVWALDIPRGLFVLHHCDNRRCVNPTHLRLGTHQDNMADMVRKKRAKNGYSSGTAKRGPRKKPWRKTWPDGIPLD